MSEMLEKIISKPHTKEYMPTKEQAELMVSQSMNLKNI